MQLTHLHSWTALVVAALLLLAVLVWGYMAHRQRTKDLSRAWPLLVLFLVTFAVVLALNPAKAGLAIWGVSKLALGGYVGYWADRLCFRDTDRPHLLEGISRGAAWKRRSLIVAAAIIAAALIP